MSADRERLIKALGFDREGRFRGTPRNTMCTIMRFNPGGCINVEMIEQAELLRNRPPPKLSAWRRLHDQAAKRAGSHGRLNEDVIDEGDGDENDEES